MSNLLDLSGRKVLITGASSGIGKATAVLLDSLGAKTVLVGRDEQRLSETAQSLVHEHLCIPYDLLDFDNYDKLFAKATADGEKLNGLVHCAGIAPPTPLKALGAKMIHNIIDTNFTSFIMLCSVYEKKKYSIGGSIVGFSSVNAHLPRKYMSIYSGSKAATEVATKTIALELAKKNIRINCVAPGVVDTPMIQEMNTEVLNEMLNYQLLGITDPEQIAHVVAFLLSDASSIITGRTIYADSGMLGQLLS